MSLVELPCTVHIDELEIDTERDGPPGCPECGKLLSWTHCWFCGTEWLVFGNGGDDIMGDCMVTSSMDLMCADCAHSVELEEQEYEEDYD